MKTSLVGYCAITIESQLRYLLVLLVELDPIQQALF